MTQCPPENEAGQDMKELEAKRSLFKTGKTIFLESCPVMRLEDNLMLIWDSRGKFCLSVCHCQCCKVTQTTKTNVTFYSLMLSC